MSTEAAALPAPEAETAIALRRARVLRFAVGTTLATAVAYAFAWPLYFLTPVLTITFLARPQLGFAPGMWKLSLHVLAAVGLGLAFSLFLQPYALVYIVLLGLVIFKIYYLLNRRGPFFLAVMSLLAVLILPLAGMAYEEVATVLGAYFALSVSLAILICILAHALFPDPPSAPPRPRPTFQSGYVPAAARAALKSTLAVWPLAVLFMAAEFYSDILVLVFAAVLSLVPQAARGWATGMKLLASTLFGCLAAIVVYWLLVAVPEYHFFLVVWLLAMTVFAGLIFSDRPLAGYMGSAATAMTVLVSGSLSAQASFVDEMVGRVLLIAAATLYVSAAMSLLDRFLFAKAPR